MVKIAFFEIEDWEAEYIKKRLKEHKLRFFSEPINKSISQIKDFDVLAVFIYSQLDKKVIGKLKRLKLVTTMSTGFDHVDLTECRKRKITVCNVPSYGENTVAEHTFGLLLTISKKLFESIERTKKGDFTTDASLRGFDLKDKTIGIIGTGRIGAHVARIAKGFEMNILAFDIHPNNRLAQQLGFKYVTLSNLLKRSDIITLHTPLTKKTHYLINRKNIKLIKKGAVLINTARGGLVETEALIQALNNKIISYAGLDVLEDETAIKEEKELLSDAFKKKFNLRTLLEEHVLMHAPNVYVTPHNAFNSTEALERIMDVTIDNIKSFLKGKIKNKVS